MQFNVDPQQIFSWALRLTSHCDYQSLTHDFLDLLKNLPYVDHVAAYEIYGARKFKTGEARSIYEQLVRRFPLNFGEYDREESDELLREIGNARGFNIGKVDAEGLGTQIIASICDVCGPDRALFLRGRFDEAAQRLLSNLVTLYRNQVALHDGKERDILTKLPNRQSFDSKLLQVCEYFQAHKLTDQQAEKSSWIAMLDIDHFKRINDTFGHLYGDEVLLVFSQLMEKHFRYNDFLFRFGGEEFVVILNLVNLDDAENAFERFRKAVADHLFPTVGQVTVSIGIAHIDSSVIPTTLLDRADKALYYAKDTGRNRVAIYEKIADTLENTTDGETELF